MTEEQISNIVDTVYKSTLNGNLKWEPCFSIFNSDTRHKYQALSSDGKTKFTCDLTLKSDMSGINVNQYDTLDIHNENIIDGVARCNSNVNPNVILIYQWIYDNHLKKTVLVKSIDTAEYRDKKLNIILGESDTKEEKKGIFKKLFGK